MNDLFLVLGSNEGNRLLEISKSIVLIYKSMGNIINRSPIYETEPWGFKGESKFINLAIHVNTELSCKEVLSEIHCIEDSLGRERKEERYSSRKIDIDIIFYNNDIIKDVDLIVPHEHITKRKFVLQPLNDICPDFVHPELNKDVKTLLNECADKCRVEIYERPT